MNELEPILRHNYHHHIKTYRKTHKNTRDAFLHSLFSRFMTFLSPIEKIFPREYFFLDRNIFLTCKGKKRNVSHIKHIVLLMENIHLGEILKHKTALYQGQKYHQKPQLFFSWAALNTNISTHISKCNFVNCPLISFFLPAPPLYILFIPWIREKIIKKVWILSSDFTFT